MGGVELVFLAVFVIFGVVGVVRGYARELGVTTMLLLALFILELIDERYRDSFEGLLVTVTGSAGSAQSLRTVLFCIFLIVIAYISYEGETLGFPGKGRSTLFGLGTGLLNGYLFAGSLWYYLDKASWLSLPVSRDFTAFYLQAVKFLPPAIFKWTYLVGLAVFMLIMRVWK